MNRKLIKENARLSFRANYWKCVGASIILGLTVGGTGISTYRSYTDSEVLNRWVERFMYDSTMLAILLSFSASVIVIGILVHLFALRPLYAGCQGFFLKNVENKADFETLVSGFKENYRNTVLTFLLHDVLLILWTCLLIIPGVIKMYSYRMVPFILAENPDMAPMEIIKKSEEMMRGYKWEAFLLDVSFIGWWVLSLPTFGILALFWTRPYTYQADAELYKVLKYKTQNLAIA